MMSAAGILLCAGLVVVGIVFSRSAGGGSDRILVNLRIFYDLPGIAVVFGGTAAALMLSFPPGQFAKIPKHLRVVFFPTQYVPEKYVAKLVACAKKARAGGLLALEEDADTIADAFLQNSLRMLVDFTDPEKVKGQMELWCQGTEERHMQQRAFYEKGAQLAPAFGMIGTLARLIGMLKNLRGAASAAPELAAALAAAFYGLCLANLVFAPISNKLCARHDEEYLCMQIVCEGIQAIQSGDSPKLVKEKLVRLLPAYRRRRFAEQGAGAEPFAGGSENRRKIRKSA